MARVLIVEDEYLHALHLEAGLKPRGHIICGIAHTADQAIAYARSTRPDVILMDVKLSGGSDGIAAAEMILSERPCSLIFITAYSDDTTTLRMSRLERGCGAETGIAGAHRPRHRPRPQATPRTALRLQREAAAMIVINSAETGLIGPCTAAAPPAPTSKLRCHRKCVPA